MIYLGCGTLSRLLSSKSTCSLDIAPISVKKVRDLVSVDNTFIANSCISSEYVSGIISAKLGVSVPTSNKDCKLKKGDVYIIIIQNHHSFNSSFLQLKVV